MSVTKPETSGESSDQAMNLTERLINRLSKLDVSSPEVLTGARHCILDTLGVAIGGTQEEVVIAVMASVLEEGSGAQAVVWGTETKVSRTQAALINGTAAHALDFDDVSAAMEGHPSAPLVPALLAVAQGTEITGRELLEAFIVGFESEALIGRLMSPSHYARGFHTTATVGTFGAAVSSGRVLGLTDSQQQHALGIAGSQASGLKSMFGTMTKPLQVGYAAESGVRAALLARRGVTANTDVLGAEQGFRDTQSAESGIPEAWKNHKPAVTDVLFKYHAACYLTHSAVEGLLRLRESGLKPEHVDRLILQVPPGHLKVCNIQAPRTPLEGKFSLRFVSALALHNGDLSEQAFTEQPLQDPEVMGFLNRVEVHARQDTARSTVVTVIKTDCSTQNIEVDVNAATPPAELERRWHGLVAKFHSLVDPVLGAEAADKIISLVAQLDDAPSIEPLFEALSHIPGGQA